MTVFVYISLTISYGAYVLDLAVLYCECELSHCSITVRSNCLLKAVLAVLKTSELSAVAIKCDRLVISCKRLSLFALAYNYAIEVLALILSCEHECCLAC